MKKRYAKAERRAVLEAFAAGWSVESIATMKQYSVRAIEEMIRAEMKRQTVL